MERMSKSSLLHRRRPAPGTSYVSPYPRLTPVMEHGPPIDDDDGTGFEAVEPSIEWLDHDGNHARGSSDEDEEQVVYNITWHCKLGNRLLVSDTERV